MEKLNVRHELCFLSATLSHINSNHFSSFRRRSQSWGRWIRSWPTRRSRRRRTGSGDSLTSSCCRTSANKTRQQGAPQSWALLRSWQVHEQTQNISPVLHWNWIKMDKLFWRNLELRAVTCQQKHRVQPSFNLHVYTSFKLQMIKSMFTVCETSTLQLQIQTLWRKTQL